MRLTRRGRIVSWLLLVALVTAVVWMTRDTCWIPNQGYGSCQVLMGGN